MRIRIESEGHVVEIDGSALDHTLPQVLDLAVSTWHQTKPVEAPRQQMGFGSQLVERSNDKPIPGAGTYETKPAPVTS